MSEFDKVINAITPEIYQNLQQSVAIGRWPDGRQLTKEQRASSLQLIIAYDNKYKQPDEHTGTIANSKCASKTIDESQIIKSQSVT